MAALVLYNALSLVIGLLGVGGNAIVLYVSWKKRNNSNKLFLQNPFLISLAFMDFASAIAMTLTFAARLVPTPSPEGSPWTVLYLHCLLVEGEAVVWILVLASPMGLVGLTIERYFKVVYPITHKNFTSKKCTCFSIALVWLVPCLCTSLFFFFTTHIKDGKCLLFDFPSYELSRLYSFISLTLSYLLPLLTFFFCYTHMLLALHNQHNWMVSNRKRPSFLRTAKINVTITMILVCLCFIIFWSPTQIYWTLSLVGMLELDANSAAFITGSFISYINTVLNPVIYVFRIKELRLYILNHLYLGHSVNQARTSCT